MPEPFDDGSEGRRRDLLLLRAGPSGQLRDGNADGSGVSFAENQVSCEVTGAPTAAQGFRIGAELVEEVGELGSLALGKRPVGAGWLVCRRHASRVRVVGRHRQSGATAAEWPHAEIFRPGPCDRCPTQAR